jgi:anti-anti-sigma factor
MNLDIESLGDTMIVRVKERELTYPLLADFYARATALIDSGARELVINLSQVRYLDSASLGCLMDISRNISARNGMVKLVGLQDRVAALASMVGLNTRMEILPGNESASATIH